MFSYFEGHELQMKSITQRIDHTLLRANATSADIVQLCAQARQYGFFAVCINPIFVSLAKRELQNTDVKVAVVIGFPLGANLSATKALEARLALQDGADEFDMVMNIGAARSGDWGAVEDDIRAVVAACSDRVVKVILETCLLDEIQKREACLCAKRAGARFVKTSTGFSSAGATEADIRLMRATVGPDFGVKASGGMKTPKDFEKMLSAGADRLGTSGAVAAILSQSPTGDY